MNVIAIDGACRRNGQPDCVSSGGVFIEIYASDMLVATQCIANYEVQSTNQRGELLALLTALRYINTTMVATNIVTDSEYIFNAVTKEWFVGWESRDWLTASMEPVKNKDLWQEIKQVYDECVASNIDITLYHIKGHCISFGKVTANTLLEKDHTGKALLDEVYRKYDATASQKADKLADANELSLKNNGFKLDPKILRHFVVINTMADAIATKCVETAFSSLK